MSDETPKTIKIEGVHYNAETLSQKGINLINNISEITTVIKRANIDIGIANIAKAKVVEDLLVEARENFTVVEVPDEAPEAQTS